MVPGEFWTKNLPKVCMNVNVYLNNPPLKPPAWWFARHPEATPHWGPPVWGAPGPSCQSFQHVDTNGDEAVPICTHTNISHCQYPIVATNLTWGHEPSWTSSIQWKPGCEEFRPYLHAPDLGRVCGLWASVSDTSTVRFAKGWYTERLKSTNCMELCQVSLGRRWIRKSNKLTKNQGNPNGTPRYDKLYFGKFCCVKDEDTHCGRNYQTIVKVALNFTKKQTNHTGTLMIHHM